MEKINYEETAKAYNVPVALCKLGFRYYPKTDSMTNEETYQMMKRRRAFWHGYKKALQNLAGENLLETTSNRGLKEEEEFWGE